MYIICEYVVSMALLFTLSNLLLGFCPVLIRIRRGNESPENEIEGESKNHAAN
jgi:hypothetical protein